MPRQPYRGKSTHGNYSIGALVIKDDPELCNIIGKSIACWSHVEHGMAIIFASLIGAENDAAREVFISLRRHSTQIEVLNSIKNSLRDENDVKIFEKILRVYSSLEKKRNDLAHGIFGINPDNPDNSEIVFWIDPRKYSAWHSEVLFDKEKLTKIGHQGLQQNLFVYKKRDLKIIYKDIEDFWWVIHYFSGYLRDPENERRKQERVAIDSHRLFAGI